MALCGGLPLFFDTPICPHLDGLTRWAAPPSIQKWVPWYPLSFLKRGSPLENSPTPKKEKKIQKSFDRKYYIVGIYINLLGYTIYLTHTLLAGYTLLLCYSQSASILPWPYSGSGCFSK